MPSSIDNQYLIPKKYDNRRKLTDVQKIKIRALRKFNPKKWTHAALANKFNVSKRLIQFIIDPQKRLDNVQTRRDRGYKVPKEKHRDYVRQYRKHKRELLLENKLIKKEN